MSNRQGLYNSICSKQIWISSQGKKLLFFAFTQYFHNKKLDWISISSPLVASEAHKGEQIMVGIGNSGMLPFYNTTSCLLLYMTKLLLFTDSSWSDMRQWFF